MATASTLKIGPADHGRTMTLDEFLDAEETRGYRYELARGVLEVTEVPHDPHGLIVSWFYIELGTYARAHPELIHRFGGAGEFRLWLPTMISGRNPDVAVVLKGKPRDSQGRRPPSLVAEIVSEGREARERDYVTKRAEYLAFGVEEYWIVDPIDRRVVVLTRNGDAWVEHVFLDDQSAEGLVLPGFSIRLSDLWAAAESDPDDHSAGE